MRIGTAGWAIPHAVAKAFPAGGSGLTRYAGRLTCAEINSSFYRPHKPQTYARWAASTPADFRFSVKIPKSITHEARLIDCRAGLHAFLAPVRELGEKLGPLLVQLPPSLRFNAGSAAAFLSDLRDLFDGPVAIEPRHATWFEADPDALLVANGISRVAADPPPHPAAAQPAGDPALAYWRMHGSPRMYFTPYGDARLAALADLTSLKPAADTWVIFDNTTSGAAASDALALLARTSV